VSDRISIRGLSAQGVVGVHDWERAAPRELRIDLDLEVDLGTAAASDDLRDTVDYDALASAVRARVAATPRRLIEAVAEDVVAACLADPRVRGVVATVHKPGAVAAAEGVSVTVCRRP
jgi:dihydroneopterin aldolase